MVLLCLREKLHNCRSSSSFLRYYSGITRNSEQKNILQTFGHLIQMSYLVIWVIQLNDILMTSRLLHRNRNCAVNSLIYFGNSHKTMEAIGVAISCNSNYKHFMNLSFSKYYYYLFRIILYISFLKVAFRQALMLQLVSAKC